MRLSGLMFKRDLAPGGDGRSALYFKPEDKDGIANAMRQVLEDRNLRITLSERGVRRAALFNWRKMAVETIQAYREIAPWIPAARLTP